jgi:hypothetical protein
VIPSLRPWWWISHRRLQALPGGPAQYGLLFSFYSVTFFYNFWNIWWNKKYSDSKISFLKNCSDLKFVQFEICSLSNFIFKFRKNVQTQICSDSNLFKLEFVQIQICSNSFLFRFEFVQTRYCWDSNLFKLDFVQTQIFELNIFWIWTDFRIWTDFWIWTDFQIWTDFEFEHISNLNRF